MAHAFLPALRFDCLTGLFDRILRATLREDALRARLVEQVAPRAGQRLLDLGCGTATLSILLKQACPASSVTGLDVDDRILSIARRKVDRAGLSVGLVHGTAFQPPFADARFDRVAASLMLHHLPTDGKLLALQHARRMLAPDGELHVFDLGRPSGWLMRAMQWPVRLFDGFALTHDHVAGRIAPMIEAAGFRHVAETQSSDTMLGTLRFWRASA